MQTLYVVTNQRYSPNPDVMTLRELRAMLDDLGWSVSLFEKRDGIYDVHGFKWRPRRKSISRRRSGRNEPTDRQQR